MNYLILLIAFIPVWLEILLDFHLWKQGRNDKPVSTILRAVLFFCIALIFMVSGLSTFLQTMLLLFASHLLAFDYVLNTVRGKPFFYVGKDGWWEVLRSKVTWWQELGIKIWIYYVSFLVFFKLEWITDGIPQGTKLIEYFIP